MLKFMEACMVFGYPSHRIQSLQESLARVFGVRYGGTMMPGVSIMAFGRWSEPRVVRADSSVQLSRINALQAIYRDVLEDYMFPSKGRRILRRLLYAPPIYADWATKTLPFMITFLIAGLAFGGSLNDMWLAGVMGYIIRLAQSDETSVSLSSLGNEVYLAAIVSFVTRYIDYISNHIFCFSTLSSSAIIPMLPGSAVCE